MSRQAVEQCARLLAERQYKIAFAESATAGRLAAEFALSAHSGQCLLGGIICYDAQIKQALFKVPTSLIEQFTPESAQVTRAITEQLAGYFDAQVRVGVTGLTCPGGSETPQKPVGSMFFHFIINDTAYAHREVFAGTPEQIMLQSIDRIAELIIQYIQAQTQDPAHNPA